MVLKINSYTNVSCKKQFDANWASKSLYIIHVLDSITILKNVSHILESISFLVFDEFSGFGPSKIVNITLTIKC